MRKRGLRSNQNRDVDALYDDVEIDDIDDAAKTAVWPEIRNHGPGSTCACPMIEGIARLYELGYRVVKS